MIFAQKTKEEFKAVGITALYFGCWIAGLLFIKTLVLAAGWPFLPLVFLVVPAQEVLLKLVELLK